MAGCRISLQTVSLISKCSSGGGSRDMQEGKSGKKGAEKLAKEVSKITLPIPILQDRIVR